MVSVLLGFLTSFVTWLVGHLPNSPFVSVTLGFDGFAGSGFTLEMLLGWLNWLIPVGDMLVLFTAWCLAALAFVAIRFVIRPIRNAVGRMSVLGE